MEETLNQKSCILCKFKGYAKDFVSLVIAPTKLVCKTCVKVLYVTVVHEEGKNRTELE